MSLARSTPPLDEPDPFNDGSSERFNNTASPDGPDAPPPVGLDPRRERFAKFAWLVLVYNLAVVAWGVFVRAGKFGDGCGSHWPLCDGSHEPLMGPMARFVEASHRITTSFCGVLALAMLVWAFRLFPKKHVVRKGAVAVFGFTLLEGLVGAALVKFGWVTDNDTPARAAVMAFHVVSTFFLLGSIGVALLGAIMPRPPKLKGQATIGWILGVGFAGIVLLRITGAVSALGHQLKPVDNVIQAAMNPATHWMVRLQPMHPLLAVSVGLYLLLGAGLVQHLRPDSRVRQAAKWMLGLFGAQMVLGLLTIFFKAPIGMQMLHLVMADVNLLSLVALGTFAFAEGIEKVEKRPAPVEAPHVEPLSRRQLVGAYVALTKPRVISLLLFCCLAAMIAAKGSWPGLGLFLVVAVGGYMAAGAANAINMVVDRDIDLAMKRTSTRPTVTQSIPSAHALAFSFVLAVGSFGLLWGFANLLSAVMAFSGLVFYVVVYTLLLKRRTWHNIVIGGAAGAFPPLVGWAAVTNDLPPLSLLLFAIIFVWTPVHFWALALLLKDEYAAAGVPMLPVVKGDRETVMQIVVYAILTCGVTFAPLLMPQVGWIYAIGAAALNAVLLVMSVRLFRQADRPHASSLFHFSMIYLALLFLALAIDRTVVIG